MCATVVLLVCSVIEEEINTISWFVLCVCQEVCVSYVMRGVCFVFVER